MDTYIVLVMPGYTGAYAMDPNGIDLLETVDFVNHPTLHVSLPDWDAAGVCDHDRGDSPEFQLAVRAALAVYS